MYKTYLIGVVLLLTTHPAAAVEYAENPLLLNEHLLVSDQGLAVYDPVTLRLRWSVLQGEQTLEPVVADGLVLLSGGQGLQALDLASGKTRWRWRSETTLFSPSLDEGVAYLSGEDGTLVALRLVDGERLWQRRFDGWVYPPAVFGELLITGGSEGLLWAVDRRSGELRWQRPLGQELIYSPRALDSGSVVVTTFAGEVKVYSAQGELRWTRRFASLKSGLLVSGERILLSGLDGRIDALDAATGESLWQRSLGERLTLPAALHGERLLVVGDAGHLFEIDTGDGRLISRTRLIGEPVAAPLVYPQHTLFFMRSRALPRAVLIPRQSGDNNDQEI
ncbi:PQQ-binding-like beta-propeller repeat protein [Candidatus Endoriftia persephone]|jgi:outer membrane protein assembly factor BamB|uniref:Serine/threonine protein kinase related protein n=3 Tax=Gammaproteobacteria TaxID=1236 RepID=G2FAY2_9GAMM|nr:PQQ-binding-like beta-propeller repeat protein [Candidatus Endoriftia persephone]EGW55920.1 serine/threonine protein kinase related protein [endosymbiont of Tevnia jerichonana (vent Tica)]USF88056.1 PQQ-binding-like beta-propeller repeat protein [Candidatus Endoriftia persephone]